MYGGCTEFGGRIEKPGQEPARERGTGSEESLYMRAVYKYRRNEKSFRNLSVKREKKKKKVGHDGKFHTF